MGVAWAPKFLYNGGGQPPEQHPDPCLLVFAPSRIFSYLVEGSVCVTKRIQQKYWSVISGIR